MATAILSPRDCLQSRFLREAFALRSSPRVARNDAFANPNPRAESRRRKRSPMGSQRDRAASRSKQSLVAKLPGNNLVMGQVKILKRGELLDSVEKSEDEKEEGKKLVDLRLGSTDRFGPEPETVRKEVRVEEFNKAVDVMYAGSAFFTSPPPSSLPVPAFLGKGGVGDANTDLRRLLGLNLV
ncbi:unnamed protein product [Linum tenue]|uniref:Peptidylprolyl isomerase n=1 Tax=Linum tenue TaxID=586396 RepID=A0AAV0QAF3_9ROSI|nr:unnamed protein product [Linum tenue]